MDSETPATEQPKKARVRATLADQLVIAKAIEEHAEQRTRIITGDEPDFSGAAWGYRPQWTDERIAREYAPHLAAHHVAVVREALYPEWEKRPAEMTVEDRLADLERVLHGEAMGRVLAMEGRLTALEERVNVDVYRRLNAIDSELDGPTINQRLDTLERQLGRVASGDNQPTHVVADVERRLQALEQGAKNAPNIGDAP